MVSSILKGYLLWGLVKSSDRNLDRVIIGAYRWLSDNYRPGDQIFLFGKLPKPSNDHQLMGSQLGFSRGAYQVRAIAGMIATVRLVQPTR